MFLQYLTTEKTVKNMVLQQQDERMLKRMQKILDDKLQYRNITMIDYVKKDVAGLYGRYAFLLYTLFIGGRKEFSQYPGFILSRLLCARGHLWKIY